MQTAPNKQKKEGTQRNEIKENMYAVLLVVYYYYMRMINT